MFDQFKTNTTTSVLGGGEFIYRESDPSQTFTPEEFDEEQLMMRDSVRTFGETEVFPNIKAIEKQQDNIGAHLLAKAGALGFLGANIPEEYGGMNLDTNTNALLTEEIGRTMSFSVSVAAHTGIGILPIFYFGTEEQKLKYLPALASGEAKASYCLTEPNSGSDALAARTTATLSADGKYYSITGQKMWITNAGFADLFIVFAKIDGKLFTGFIVERDTEGLSFGAEEDKMGIKGSSTRQVFFDNAKVPAENILGEIGKGHLIAFNVLNMGRFKLGLMALGASKRNTTMAVKYANDRQQFGQPIAAFGAIQHKLAQEAVQIYALESTCYRISALLQHKVKELQAKLTPAHTAYLEAAEEYAIEAALVKVFGSEVYFNVADETLQIHGGNGFSEEFGAARDHRDNRINRIFEGTNEINRILMINMLLRRLPKDLNATMELFEPFIAQHPDNPLLRTVKTAYPQEQAAVQNAKSILLVILAKLLEAQADKKFNLKDEQEVATNLSDIMIDIFAMESMLLRLAKQNPVADNDHIKRALDATISSKDEVLLSRSNDVFGGNDVFKTSLEGTKKESDNFLSRTESANPFGGNSETSSAQQKMMEVYFADAMPRILKRATDAIVSFVEEHEIAAVLEHIQPRATYKLFNIKAHRRAIAHELINANTYCF